MDILAFFFFLTKSHLALTTHKGKQEKKEKKELQLKKESSVAEGSEHNVAKELLCGSYDFFFFYKNNFLL